MVGPIAVQLQDPIVITQNGEILAGLMRRHGKNIRQKRHLRPHIPHQKVQPDTCQRRAEFFCAYRVVIHLTPFGRLPA